MSYEQKFELVRKSLISYCKDCISENYERMFDMWLNCEADMVFGHGYQDKFKEEFSKYMNIDIEARLWFAGKNIVFAIQTFIDTNPNYTLNKLLNFVDTFLRIQLDDFGNWCDDIMMAMSDEVEHD